MPTGYTSIIEDRADVTFPEFLWRCAHGFLIEMRESSLDTPVPRRIESDIAYHTEQIGKATVQLAVLRTLTPEAIEEQAASEHESRMRERKLEQIHYAPITARYVKIRAKVVAWAPPTPLHNELRRFMLSQIDESMKYLASSPEPEPERITGAAWLAWKIGSAEYDIRYHAKSIEVTRLRAEERNDWVAALMESVPQPKRMTK